ncbi:MAG: SsgA family sporulation/cell division regulator [Candidatus Nanopelagicales bacterium]
MSPTAVTVELYMRMVVDSDRTVDVPCSLEYRVDEPFAVRATFNTGASNIEWMFARDLLVEGLRRPSGEGDVIIWPEHMGQSPLILMALSSPSGQAVLEADRVVMEAFLARTFELVPEGSESASVDIDIWINAILGEGLTEV